MFFIEPVLASRLYHCIYYIIFHDESDESDETVQNDESDESLRDVHKSSLKLLSQRINKHFVFNTNNISYLSDDTLILS